MIPLLQLFESMNYPRGDAGFWMDPRGKVYGFFPRHEHLTQFFQQVPGAEEIAGMSYPESVRSREGREAIAKKGYLWGALRGASKWVDVEGTPNRKQKKELKDMAIELGYRLRAWLQQGPVQKEVEISLDESAPAVRTALDAPVVIGVIYEDFHIRAVKVHDDAQNHERLGMGKHGYNWRYAVGDDTVYWWRLDIPWDHADEVVHHIQSKGWGNPTKHDTLLHDYGYNATHYYESRRANRFLSLFEKQEWDPLVGLYNYLSLSDEEKRDDLAHFATYNSDDWLTFLEQETGRSYDPWDDLPHPGDRDFPDELFEKFKAQLDMDSIANEVLQHDPANAPAWLTMWAVSPPREYELVHYTDDPWPILNNGFLGFADIQRLALTTYFNDSAFDKNVKEGYAFAFEAGSRHDGKKYGEHPIRFNARAVECYHSGDGEYQMVFWAPDAKNIREEDEEDA